MSTTKKPKIGIVPPVIQKKKREHPLESDVESYLSKQIGMKFGSEDWKFSSPNRRSVSDRIVLIDGFVIFVEVKAVKGKSTKGQERFANKVIAQGGNACFVYGHAGVDKFIAHLVEHEDELGVLQGKLDRVYK